MRNPTNFRPTKRDNEALDIIAADYPVFMDSMTELIRVALATYPKYKQLLDRIEATERRLESLDQRVEALEELSR